MICDRCRMFIESSMTLGNCLDKSCPVLAEDDLDCFLSNNGNPQDLMKIYKLCLDIGPHLEKYDMKIKKWKRYEGPGKYTVLDKEMTCEDKKIIVKQAFEALSKIEKLKEE